MTTTTWPPAIKVKKHPRARYVKLKASLSHGLELVVPKRFNMKEVPVILNDNRAWIEKQLLKLKKLDQEKDQFVLPQEIHFQSIHETWQIEYASSTSKLQIIPRENQKILLLGKVANTPLCKSALIAWMKHQAKTSLVAQLNRISQQINLPYSKAIIRDQSSRWGSCSADKVISLNYKLLFLPTIIMEYVLIHELCHTIHLDHSDAFWNLVEKFDPRWRMHRKELRAADKFIPGWTR